MLILWFIKQIDNRKEHEFSRNKLCSDDNVGEISVSVDGTWQKRYGHNSLLGASLVLLVDNGQVLDYVIKRKTYQVCKRHPTASEEWKESHKAFCEINHTASSGTMEKDAAVEMFTNSIDRRNLKYVEYVGDGDNNSFGAIRTKTII